MNKQDSFYRYGYLPISYENVHSFVDTTEPKL